MPATADFSSQQIDRNKLLTALIDSFGENELRSLCFELNTDYDHLPPGGVVDKARELVLRFERERHLPELTEAVLKARPHIPRHSLIRDGRTDQSPFKGLPPFREKDADLFFGRDALIAELLAHLHHHHFLAVIGASGSGKSSVVQAGVVPVLKGKRPLPDGATLPEGSQNWHTEVIKPTAMPLEELAHALTRDLVTTAEQKTIQAELAADSDSLHLHLRKFLERQGRSHILLVVDQFEELFTLVRSEPERRAFIENLLTAVSHPHPTLHLIVTLRADFYHHCAQFTALRQALASQQHYIGEMSREELRQAIELPAQRSRLAFEPGLVELLLRDVGAAEGQSPEPGALPLLSHALLETWGWREVDTLTLAGYTAAGGVHGAIAQTAESTYQSLTPTQQAIARNIFLRLTALGEGTQDTRRRANLDELLPKTAEAAEVADVLELLVMARLVTKDKESAEVAHEALIREWPTLRRWLDEDREGLRIHRQLTEAATEWERTARDVNYLYPRGRLAQAREWAAMPEVALNELEQAFLDAGLAQQQDELAAAKAVAEREAEAARKLRQRAVFLRSALVIAAALAVASFLLFGQSSRNAAESERNAAQADTASTRAFENLAEANAQSTRAFENEGTAVAEAATAEAAEATAIYSVQMAATREMEANDQRQKALVQSLAALSAVTYERDQNPELAILLGIEAARLNESSQTGTNFLVDNSLRSILQEYAYYYDTLTGHENLITSVVFAPNGQTLASGSQDGTIRLWESNNPMIAPAVLIGHEGPVISLAFSPDGKTLASGSSDNTIRLWDTNDPMAEPTELTGHRGEISSVAFSPDGQTLASGSSDNTIRLWDTNDPMAEPIELTGHSRIISSVAFSPDGQTLASGSFDDTIRLWNMANPMDGSVVLTEHVGFVFSVVFSPDGQTLASGSGNIISQGKIHLWDVNNLTAKPVVLAKHENWVFSVAFSPNGQMLASGSADDTIRLWNMNDPTARPMVLTGHEDWVHSVAFSLDGEMLASGSSDGSIRLWDINNPTAVPMRLTGHEAWVNSIAFSPDGQILASGGVDNMRLWDMNDSTPKSVELAGQTGWVGAVAFSPDGQTIASGSEDGTIRLRSMSNPIVELAVLNGHEDSIFSVAFSPDGQTLASGSADDTIRLWNMNDPTAEPVVLTGHEGSILSLAFSPDGQALASGSSDDTIRLWNTSDLIVELVVLTGHEDRVRAVAFAPDGQTIASGSEDGTIRLWDMNNWAAEPMVLVGHKDWVRAVTFSFDGQTLASASDDTTIRLWDMNHPKAEPVVLTGHEDLVWSVAFSPDGHTLASGSRDGTILLWPTLEELVQIGCQQVGRNLNQTEWQLYVPGQSYRQTCSHLPRHPSVPPDE